MQSIKCIYLSETFKGLFPILYFLKETYFLSRGVIDQCQTKNYIENSFLGSFKLVICKQICQDQTDRPLGFLSKVLELLDNKQMGSGVHFSKNIIPVLICGRFTNLLLV